MTALTVLNADSRRTVEMHPELFEVALRTFQVNAAAVFDTTVVFLSDGVCLVISHREADRTEILLLHVDEVLITSLLGPGFAEEHGGWFDMKPLTIESTIAHFIQVAMTLRSEREQPVKVRIIRVA